MSLFLNTEAASALSIFLVLPDLIKAKEKPIRGRPCNVALCLRYYLGRHIYKNNRPASVPCDPPSSPCQPHVSPTLVMSVCLGPSVPACSLCPICQVGVAKQIDAWEQEYPAVERGAPLLPSP